MFEYIREDTIRTFEESELKIKKSCSNGISLIGTHLIKHGYFGACCHLLRAENRGYLFS